MSKFFKDGGGLYQKLQCTGLDTLYIYYYRHRGKNREAVIRRYLGDNVSKKEMRRLKRRMRYAYIRYAWNFEEYFMWHFETFTHKERKNFVPDLHKHYFCERVNPKRYHTLFMNKGLTYEAYKDYYKRDVCMVSDGASDLQKFGDFIQNHDSFIVKPLTSYMGRGVKIFRGAVPSDAEKILQDYKEGLVAEELIEQVDELSAVYPTSVNTVRITTLLQKDSVAIVHPFIRFGRGGNIVDNGGQGGLFCALDVDSGRVLAVRDEMGVGYEVHPDTKVPLVGFVVPKWEEVVALGKKLALETPDCPYIGWDFALTKDGWIMVEGNSQGQFVGFQLPSLVGFRQEFNELKKNMPERFLR